MLNLPFHYKLEWKWYAKTKWLGSSVPEEDRIREFISDKLSQKFYEDFIKKGWALQVGVVNTVIDKVVTHVEPTFKDAWKHEYWAMSTVEFWTDHKSMGSPIEPATMLLLSSIIAGVISLATIGLYFAVIYTVSRTIYDIGSGIGEVFGVGGKGGLGIFFLLIIVLVGLYIVGKFFWKKKRG